ncbi:MAG: hypothetical protein AB3N63_12825 [Puniceicoccaceae bacterium]
MTHLFRNTRFFVLIGTLLASTFSLSAQSEITTETSDPGPFYGFWEFQEPAGDTCIMIIKRGGRLSCFWAGTSTRAIQKGTWERTDTALTASWDVGHTDVFKMLGENAIERSTFPAGQSTVGQPSLVIRGVRVDPRIPGSLTIEREGPREESAIAAPRQEMEITPMSNEYVGFWKVRQSGGVLGINRKVERYFYLNLKRNGEANASLRDWEGDSRVRGAWTVEGEKVIITWPNRRRDVLYVGRKGDHMLGSLRRKDATTDAPRSPERAEKVDAAEAQRYFEAANFNRLTVLDIRGTWIPAESTGRREYISIEGWGNAYRFPATTSTSGGTDPGKWRLENDRVLITWIDGSKDMIRLSMPNFVQDSFTTSEPMTGTPHRSVKVIRTSSEEEEY